jgi:leucyl-tRNA synthetase
MKKYQPKQLESKWQEIWDKKQLYASQIEDKPKQYVLDMFPYPSGAGLHVGHVKGYVATDIISRLYRLKGFNVLHPMGWDAFGLPAENYAIKTGIHPRITTEENISNFKKQMQRLGLSYDWNREISTIDPDYYKWTQWIFLKLYEQGLAYEDEAPINFCPSCKTGLANEEVVNGHCDRCGTKVEKKILRQWILRITRFAERLLEDLEGLDWPQSIKEMQINWIGRSEGANIKFAVATKNFDLEVYTTRIDTVYGTTAIVVAPEHERIEELITDEHKASVESYINSVSSKSDLERTQLNKEKTGVFTGSYAVNPVNGEEVPIWVADYVLGFYGSGAVMFVPAHDERDYEFAKKYSLPVKRVIIPIDQMKSDEIRSNQKGEPENQNSVDNPISSDISDLSGNPEATGPQEAFVDYGVLVNSGEFDGLTSEEAKKKITEKLKAEGKGDYQVNYKLRDWIFSRQRYWGEPIPLVHCKDCGIVPVPEVELPVVLPEVEKYQPSGTGESPLVSIEEWVNVKCPKCGGEAKRETNTMPQWAGSCWYYLRFCDPKNSASLLSKQADKYWMNVDFYVGGAEHAVLHLLYARFWHKVLYDLGAVSTKEPFQKLRNVGMILGPDGNKMSKSKGNVITPDQITEEYGADTLRVYEGFMGPFENAIAWDPTSIIGVYKFLNRVWEVILRGSDEIGSNQMKSDESVGDGERGVPSSARNEVRTSDGAASRQDPQIDLALNRLIKKVEQDVVEMKFNTSIAAMMEFINLVYHRDLTLTQKERFLIVLAPFAPHLSEELWSCLGHNESIHSQSWPEVGEEGLQSEELIIPVQVNGKVREILRVSFDQAESQAAIEKMAQGSEKVQKYLQNQSIKKVIYVPGKMLSLVTD